jgi:hypothetical protein
MIREAEHEALRALVRRWRDSAGDSMRNAVSPVLVMAAAQAFRAIEREDAAKS